MKQLFYSLKLRFVLYQLSKNLNRPFFMEFLTKLSVEYDKECHEDEPLLGGTVLVESKFQVNNNYIMKILLC